MLLSAILALLAASPLAVDAFPAYAQRLATTRSGNVAKRVVRRAAEPYSPEYPYTGAILNGGTGTGKGGVQVPAPGDYAHYYQDPPPGAQRGPCPGLNTLANHGFISRDGITTYSEMIAALQNVYNLNYTAAVGLTVLGFVLDGDPVSELLSIGGSVPLVTGKNGEFTGEYLGISGHGTFELDVSLTRNDYYLRGDAYSFNGTMFGMMVETAQNTSNSTENPIFDFNAIALYRSQLYDRARVENPYLLFNTLSLHNYGASSFLFNAFPSSAKNNTPDLETISSFFGAVQADNGSWTHVGERTPPNWHNQVAPLTDLDISQGILQLFGAYPKPFGANINGTWYPIATNASSYPTTADGLICYSYNEIIQHAQAAPQPYAMLEFVIEKANPIFANVGCPVYTL